MEEIVDDRRQGGLKGLVTPVARGREAHPSERFGHHGSETSQT